MLSSRSARTTLASAALACSALLMACTDPEGGFADFENRDAKDRAESGAGGEGGEGGGGVGGGSACTPPAAQAADGDFLFALAANIDPSKPVVFLTKLTTTAEANGLGFSLSLQPLQAADRKTPTGDALNVGPFDVGADGKFSASLPTLTVPGDGNPISGSELEATITLAGSICAPVDLACGDVTGNLTKPVPLDLAGSTFAMVRVTDPSAYPEVVIDCAKTPAPLPMR